MAVEEVAAGALRLLLRCAVEVFIEGLFQGSMYWVGLGTLRVVSLGRYPPEEQSPRQEALCSFVGLFVTVAAGLAAFGLWYAGGAGWN